MNMQQRFQSLCIIFSLLMLLCACNQSEKENRTATPSPSPTAPTEATQTCPAAGKARAAIMPAMSASGQENLIYVSRSTMTDDATTLRRYNAATGKTTTFVKGNIAQRAISPDRQWMALNLDAAHDSLQYSMEDQHRWQRINSTDDNALGRFDLLIANRFQFAVRSHAYLSQ